jgi:hypothetical protein
MWRWNGSNLVGAEARVVACIEGGCLSGLRWAGWGAYRVDDSEFEEPPVLAFCCPAGAKREFGSGPRGFSA